MDDKDLIKLSMEVDNILVATCNKYNISALSLSAAVLARLLLLNIELGSEDDFRKLMIQAANQTEPDSITLQ